jgi:hypothetical protein
MRSSNDPTEPWPWKHPRTRARAPPGSCWTRCSGSIGTAHIPDAGRHCQRFYGAYSNRARVTTSSAGGDSAGRMADTQTEKDNPDFSREARSTWARLLRKIFEVDPLLCACGGRRQMVSLITEPRLVDRILRHRESERCKAQDPFEPRAPPQPQSWSWK